MRHLVVGLLHALGAALGIAVVLGILLYATPLSEARLPLLATVGGALAVFWGALKASHLAGSAGLWHGLGVGLLFSLVVLLLSWTGVPHNLAAWGEKLGLSLLAGALGGIAGVAGR
ncbi:TIGR04086 family membrane protein [Moorellaceae bacterium AZ2]